MTVEDAVRESRCRVAVRMPLASLRYEFAGPFDDPHAEAKRAGWRPWMQHSFYENVSLLRAVKHEDWQPCLPKTVVDKLGDLASKEVS